MLKGTLDDFTLADVFRLLSLAKRTGKLDVKRSAGSGRVFFRDGEIYYADSSMSREPLGKKLIRAHVVTEIQLMTALDQAAAGEGRVGDILVSSGVATVEQLQAAVKQQIEDAVFEMLRWDRGKFSWDLSVEADVEVPIAVSVENLIMESSRRLEELDLINRKIPGESTVPGMAPSPPEGAVEINITPEEWRILVLIDGQRTVRDISAGSGWDEFTTMRTLYGLVSAGLVEILGPPAEPAVEPGESVPGFDSTQLPEAAPEAEAVPEPEAVPETDATISLEPALQAAETSSQINEFPAFDEEPQSEFTPDVVEEPVVVDAAAETESVEPEPIVAAAPDPMLAAAFESMVSAAREPEEPAIVEPPASEFEQPQPAAEPFLSDLLRSEPEQVEPLQPHPEAETETQLETEPLETKPQPEPVAAAEPAAEPVAAAAAAAAAATLPPPGDTLQLEIDKAEMARELSGLFREDNPAFRPLIPGETEGSTAPPRPPKAPPPVRKRVEDDEQVTKGLISRLIDGVKGL